MNRISTLKKGLSYGKRTLSSLYWKYQEEALRDPEGFWGSFAENLVWEKKWNKVIDNSEPPFTKWFTGGEFNMCYNCVDRHVDSGHGDSTALIWDSPVTQQPVLHMSYRELQDKVSKLARYLVNIGVEPGDRVLVYMPMILEGTVAMMACARIGAIHNTVFGGFAAKELSVRINASKPKVIIAASHGVQPNKKIPFQPILQQAVDMSAHKPQYCIYKNRADMEPVEVNGRTVVDMDEVIDSVAVGHDCVALPADHPLYILYTSGTTGTPKAIQRNGADYATVLHYTMKNEFLMDQDETWFSATDYGWIVGHSYCVYAPLLHRNPSIIFEGKPVGTPDATTLHRILSEYDVRSAFVSPSIMRILRRSDPEGLAGKDYPRPNFRYMYIAGERCDISTLQWMRDTLHLTTLDNYWQTESGSPILMPPVALGECELADGSAGKATVGLNLKVVDDEGNELPDGEFGQIVAKLPLRPGFFPTLFENKEAFVDKYFSDFPGYYNTFDAGYKDAEGNVFVMARTDDIINVGAVRLSTGAIEEVISNHEDITESAVVGQTDPIMGEKPLGFIVMRPGIDLTDKITAEVIKDLRINIGPHTGLKELIPVTRLPVTISQKILRGMMQNIVNEKPYNIPSTIDKIEVVDEIIEVVDKWRNASSSSAIKASV